MPILKSSRGLLEMLSQINWLKELLELKYYSRMIKNILNPGAYPQKINLVLLILRMAVGVFMLTHGTGKFLK